MDRFVCFPYWNLMCFGGPKNLMFFDGPFPSWNLMRFDGPKNLQMITGVYRVFMGKSECGDFKFTVIACYPQSL